MIFSGKKNRIVRMVSGILFLLLAGVIFCLSAQEGEESDELSMGVINALFGGGASLAEALNASVREICHVLEFSALALPLFVFISTFPLPLKSVFFTCVAAGFVFALGDEIHQYFVPGRAFQLSDVLVDTFGVVIMAAICVFIYRRVRRRASSPARATENSEAGSAVLEAFSAYVRSEPLTAFDPNIFDEFAAKSVDHKILPMTGSALLRSDIPLTDAQRNYLRDEIFSYVTVQTRRSAKFLEAYRAMTSAGAKPLCVKGIICRSLYPDFDLRISADEDLIAGESDYPVCEKILLDMGFRPLDGSGGAYEKGFLHWESGCFIELHKTLLPEDGGVYSRFNSALGNLFENPASLRVEKTELLCPRAEKHFLYLVLHAFKHFLISGIGIRQIADISLFAKANRLDMKGVYEVCDGLNISGFLRGILGIGARYFGLDGGEYGADEEDLQDLIYDIMSGKAYGPGEREKIHSGTVTFNRYAKTIGCGRPVLSAALFPSAESMAKKYPFAGRHKLLLPLAYFLRAAGYFFSSYDTADTVSQAERRNELMKKYDILK